MAATTSTILLQHRAKVLLALKEIVSTEAMHDKYLSDREIALIIKQRNLYCTPTSINDLRTKNKIPSATERRILDFAKRSRN